MRSYLGLAGALVALLVAPGCSCSSPTLGRPCETDRDCSALEICDRISMTCTLIETPDASTCPDQDGDGVPGCAGDCDDSDALNAPTLTEVCGDNADNNCNMQAEEGCSGGIGTFVSAVTGSDSNPGTQAMPVQTIAQGIANAMTIGGNQSVIVAEGTYGEKVTMVEGIDLLGGYQCDATSCTWARDPDAHQATIENSDFEGVLAPSGVTQATLFEGFHVVGMDGAPPAPPGSAGITVRGGSPTIRMNDIVGGNVTGGGFAADRSAGIALVDTTGTLIEGNEISGGNSVPNVGVAILFDSFGSGTRAVATVRGNVLRGGTGPRSDGILAWNSDPATLITNNDIFAGNSDGGSSNGIEVGSAMVIDANRINVDRANVGTCLNPTGWCAGIKSESSRTTITNNVIFGPNGDRTTAVILGEFERPAGAIVLNGNTLNGGGTAASTTSAALVVTIGPCTTCGFNGFVGRVRNNILDGGSGAARFGVLEDPASGRMMRPEVMENNLFFFSPSTSGAADVLYRHMDGSLVTTDYDLAGINGLTTPPAAANREGDPLLDATWHLMPGSPCLDTGTSTEAPSTDFEGQDRGSSIDIGHDDH